VRLLLCDLDETLLDRSGTFQRWATEFAAARSGSDELVAWLIREDLGGYRPRSDFLAAIRRRLELDESVDELVAGFRHQFASMFECAPRVREALRLVRSAGWSIAVVTNGSAVQAEKIRAAGLDALVDAVCISGVDGYAKPDRRLLDLAAERCACSLGGAWIIGDTPASDIGAAHAVGIDSAWITTGRRWTQAAFKPTIEATQFSEAVDLILGRTQ
jgi:putative hydrolase of the HAD superfamily